MELPLKIKALYKHWEKHTKLPETTAGHNIKADVFNEIVYLVNERLNIYEKKEQGAIKPYTRDPILATYRFCNIYRELDRQTISYHSLLKPLESDFPLWLLNMLFCRSICRTETIEKVGLLSFNEAENEKVYKRLLNLPSPKYGTAYIFPISLIQRSQWHTREQFFCRYYPLVMKEVAGSIREFKEISVVAALKILLPVFGFNLKFLFIELMIDVAYQYPGYIDLFKQFPIGPGSLPTMKRINPKEDPEITNLKLAGVIDKRVKLLTYMQKPIYLSAENWEGIGCEFRKYSNLKKGEGRRRIYI